MIFFFFDYCDHSSSAAVYSLLPKHIMVPLLVQLSQVLIEPSEFSFRILKVNLACVISGFQRSQIHKGGRFYDSKVVNVTLNVTLNLNFFANLILKKVICT